MKKQIVKTITFLGIFFSSNLFAITPPTPEEYKEIVDSFKLIDTSEKELSHTFRVNGEEIYYRLSTALATWLSRNNDINRLSLDGKYLKQPDLFNAVYGTRNGNGIGT